MSSQVRNTKIISSGAPGNYIGEVVLGMDGSADDERQEFKTVEDPGSIVSSPWAMPWEQRMDIYLCRDLKENLGHFWPKVKSWLSSQGGW